MWAKHKETSLGHKVDFRGESFVIRGLNRLKKGTSHSEDGLVFVSNMKRPPKLG